MCILLLLRRYILSGCISCISVDRYKLLLCRRAHLDYNLLSFVISRKFFCANRHHECISLYSVPNMRMNNEFLKNAYLIQCINVLFKIPKFVYAKRPHWRLLTLFSLAKRKTVIIFIWKSRKILSFPFVFKTKESTWMNGSQYKRGPINRTFYF